VPRGSARDCTRYRVASTYLRRFPLLCRGTLSSVYCSHMAPSGVSSYVLSTRTRAWSAPLPPPLDLLKARPCAGYAVPEVFPPSRGYPRRLPKASAPGVTLDAAPATVLILPGPHQVVQESPVLRPPNPFNSTPGEMPSKGLPTPFSRRPGPRGPTVISTQGPPGIPRVLKPYSARIILPMCAPPWRKSHRGLFLREKNVGPPLGNNPWAQIPGPPWCVTHPEIFPKETFPTSPGLNNWPKNEDVGPQCPPGANPKVKKFCVLGRFSPNIGAPRGISAP